ncbi:MAG: hypothetical protein ACK5WS_02245 [Alphaproteobacteria bacterium]|nr:hypothetical protein [Candidatus Jidaibacter sp.]
MQNIPQNNFDRFQNNRAQVQQNVEAFLQDKNPTTLDRKKIAFFNTTTFTIDDITKTIESIDVLRDEKMGVKRYQYQDAEGNAHIIRDAREVTSTYPNTSIYSNGMLMLATARAALFMIESNLESDPKSPEFIKAKQRLCKLTNSALLKKNAQTLESVHTFNQYILDVLKDTPLKENKHLKKELQNTSHMMNFRNTAQHLTTLSTVVEADGNTSHVGIESEVMLLGFTAAQKAMFLDIKNATNTPQYAWYGKLSEYEKALVSDTLNYAMDDQGNMIHPFPTQVREILPGLRNAYYKETATLDDNNHYVQVAELFHSGSLYVKMKSEDAQDLVTDMASQLATFMSKNSTKKYIDVVLNSPANFFNSEESKVAQMVKNAMTAIGNFFSVTPLNFFRLLSGSDFTGYEHFLSEFGNAFGSMHPKFQEKSYALYYMQHGGSRSKALEEIENARKNTQYQTPKMLGIFEALENAIKARELMDSYAFIFDSQNRNLQLAKVFSDLNFSINNEDGVIRQHFVHNDKADLLDSIPQLNMHCMSGIDRLGITANRCSNNALNKHYGVQEGTDAYKANNRNIVNAGHTQAMPSLNNSGAHGVKKDSKWAIPESDYKEVEHITTNSAANNKIKYNSKASLNMEALDKDTIPASHNKAESQELTHFVEDELSRRNNKNKQSLGIQG